MRYMPPILLALLLVVCSCEQAPKQATPPSPSTRPSPETITKTDDEWRAQLTAAQYHILREKGTEPPYFNAYHDHKGDGTYRCAGCDLPLFDSSDKYDSGTGWPSFTKPVHPQSVRNVTDADGYRVETLCGRCGGHLGHVFTDGPRPIGLRYCMNSAAMQFVNR